MGYLVVFLAVVVCILMSSTTYYKLKYDEVKSGHEVDMRFREDVNKLLVELAESGYEWETMKNAAKNQKQESLADFAAPGAQITDLDTWLKKQQDREKQLNDDIYNEIKKLIASFYDTVDDNSSVSSYIQSSKLNLLTTMFCSNNVNVQEYEHVGISSSKRLALLDKISEEIEKCR